MRYMETSRTRFAHLSSILAIQTGASHTMCERAGHDKAVSCSDDPPQVAVRSHTQTHNISN